MFISSTGDMRPVQLDQIESVEEHEIKRLSMN